MEIVRQKLTAVRMWTDLRRGWRWSALQRIVVVWRVAQGGKIPFFIMQMHQSRTSVMRNIIVNVKEISRLGTELKLSLANDKVQQLAITHPARQDPRGPKKTNPVHTASSTKTTYTRTVLFALPLAARRGDTETNQDTQTYIYHRGQKIAKLIIFELMLAIS